MTDTYTARLTGDGVDETVELTLIGGLPQKSFVHGSEAGEDQVWELVSDSEDYEYRKAGIPGADYS
jgi:hypothetical protein